VGATLFGARPTVVGHRGAPLVASENTVASFAAAAAAGATWVELDVRRTADGDLAVHHDAHLDDGRPVVAVGVDELRRLGVARLEEVLQAMPAGIGVDVEVKNLPGEPDHDEAMAVVDGLLGGLALAGDRPLVVSSFNPMVLLAAAERGLQAPLALLTMGVGLEAGIEAAVELGCAGLFPHDSTEGLVEGGIALAHDAGLAVMVWTVDDVAAARALVTAGADALCTNDPQGLVDALRVTRPG
jgi:glycerophosphoryl diester phosphodiesterase